MKHKVYRSLDQSPALFGIQGVYLLVFLGALIVGIFLSVIIGSMTDRIVGVVMLIIMFLVAYFGVLFLQEKFSEKEFKRYLSMFGIPGHLRVYPERMKLDADEYFEEPVD